jgi:hypothetical protein
LGGLFYAAIFALATFVEPDLREMSQNVPYKNLQQK